MRFLSDRSLTLEKVFVVSIRKNKLVVLRYLPMQMQHHSPRGIPMLHW